MQPSLDGTSGRRSTTPTRYGLTTAIHAQRPDQQWLQERKVADGFHRWLESDRLIRTCSAQLPLTRRERARAKSLFHRLRGGDFGTHKETYAVVTCLYVIETEKVDIRRGHPNVPDKKKFAELRLGNVSKRYGITERWLRKAYARVERWVRLGELGPTPMFDKHDEELPLEYQHRLMEVLIEEAE